jgi:4-amino-4-deoxy-L-arabinose transferase-like glycosyltransferase
MNSNNKQFDSAFVIFLIIAIIYAIGNLIWWSINTPIVPMFDSAVHFTDIFINGWLFYNAPLVTYIMRFMFYIFGRELFDLIIIFVNYIFFLIPLYFIYKIGVELKDEETGNIAMILFALVPAVYVMSRQYGHKDYHIIAAITFNIYCLIKTDYFRSRKWTIWYGISVGLGLMIKDAFLAYFFVPFIYIVIKGLKEKTDRAKVINVCMSIVLGSLIAGWHYFRPIVLDKILNEPVKETVSIFAFDSLRIMTTGLWEELLSPPIFIIFITGLIYFIWKYKGKYKNIILLWFFVPWAIITFMPHRKKPEYGSGFIPAIALIGAMFISNIKKRNIKETVVIVLIIIGFVQYLDFSYKILNADLFNKLRLKYKQHYISYFNYNGCLMLLDFKQIQLILGLMNHLKNKYLNEKFLIISNSILDTFALESQILYHGMTCDKENKTILIFIGNINFIGDKFNEELKKIGLTTDEIFEIEQKYCLIDVFYLDKNKNENTKVTLFGRKDKFPQFSQ